MNYLLGYGVHYRLIYDDSPFREFKKTRWMYRSNGPGKDGGGKDPLDSEFPEFCSVFVRDKLNETLKLHGRFG